MSRFYLGIDGGQSSTAAMIAAETGLILGAGLSGPCNHLTGPEARSRFVDAIGDCVAQACREAALDPATVQFEGACCGFSGGPEDKDAYTRELIRSARYKITHDAEIALTGGTAGKPGIAIIAGTGSMAFGRNAAGVTARAGGWGYIFGDEGGSFDLVRRGLRAALQFEEGWGSSTQIRERLLEATGTRTADQLLHRFYATPRSEIAAFAQIITQVAEARDLVAQRILADAATALVGYVQPVYKQLFQSGESVPVACIGGLFRSAYFLTVFAEHLHLTGGCHAVAPRYPPAAGALIEALRLDGNYAQLSGLPAERC